MATSGGMPAFNAQSTAANFPLDWETGPGREENFPLEWETGPRHAAAGRQGQKKSRKDAMRQ